MQFETGFHTEKRFKITNTLDLWNETWNGICYVSFDLQSETLNQMSKILLGLEDANVLMMSQLSENLNPNKSTVVKKHLKNH